MTGKPVLAASASENVLFPDPASPVTMTRRPSADGASLIAVSVPHVHWREPQPGGGEAERHRAAFWRPSPVRRGERPPGGTARRRGGTNPETAPVITKISDPRGERVSGLIYYLFGPGRREEHTDPHLIAGWRHPAELEPPPLPDGHRDFRRLNGLLQQPHAALGPRGFDRPVWHCAVRAAPEDKMLSDDEWAQIAGDIMHRTASHRTGGKTTLSAGSPSATAPTIFTL